MLYSVRNQFTKEQENVILTDAITGLLQTHYHLPTIYSNGITQSEKKSNNQWLKEMWIGDGKYGFDYIIMYAYSGNVKTRIKENKEREREMEREREREKTLWKSVWKDEYKNGNNRKIFARAQQGREARIWWFRYIFRLQYFPYSLVDVTFVSYCDVIFRNSIVKFPLASFNCYLCNKNGLSPSFSLCFCLSHFIFTFNFNVFVYLPAFI